MMVNKPYIHLQSVGKAFGEQVVYQDLDLSVHQAERLAIVGPSGVGKSVMLKMLVGLLPFDQGDIIFDGLSLSTLQRDEDFLPVRRRIAMVFQGAALFDSMSVFDNIAYPLREQFDWDEQTIAAKVAEKLDWVGLAGIEAKFPAELSGGMKKRVGLARSIATDPDVILYDEPTTGLDPVNSGRIGDLILSLSARLKCTSLIVTHDMKLVEQVAERVALVYNRRIDAIGSLASLKQDGPQHMRDFMAGRHGEMLV